MALTEKQIESLFAFTEKKLVRYYDLQVELVDHLAAGIEEEMAADNGLTFDAALQKVYKRFGIFGFAKVVQEKQEALQKNNRRIWQRAVLSFFTIPKIFLSATVFLAALYVSPLLTAEARAAIVFITWFVLAIVQAVQATRAYRSQRKNLLLTQFTGAFGFSGFVFPYWIIITNKAQFHNHFLFAAFMLSVFVLELAVIQVNAQVRATAKNLYPEAYRIA